MTSVGGTRTDRALKLAEDKLFCESCGVRGKDVPKVLIVITDGKKSIESIEMPEATKNLKVKEKYIYPKYDQYLLYLYIKMKFKTNE